MLKFSGVIPGVVALWVWTELGGFAQQQDHMEPSNLIGLSCQPDFSIIIL